MAHFAAVSDKGPVREKNQDACCVEVARTLTGEIGMAVVCDGVGGLELGELASATVIVRFVRWFEEELPGLVHNGSVDISTVRIVWGAMLGELNELIQTHTAGSGQGVGTTFSGLFTCGGHYLIAHVGDSRIYQVGPFTFQQITEDQTLVARELAAGKITAEEAKTSKQRHVILQSVGTERILKPSFYEGGYTADDLFVLCSDGAYRLPESRGIRMLFEQVAHDNASLEECCHTLVEQNIIHGEKDNITIACLSTDPGIVLESALDEDDLPTMVRKDGLDDEDDLPTMVRQGGRDDEDDFATAVFSQRGEAGVSSGIQGKERDA